MIKGILIDLGKTVVTNRIISFNEGLKAVYNLSNKRISFDEYYDIHLKLYEITFKYLRRFHNEMRITDYLISLNKLANLQIDLPIEEIEDIFQKNLVEEELVEGVEEALKFFYDNKIPVIAVSNSCISGRALSVELAELGVLKYFKKVISSADLYICKPRKEIYEYAMGQLKKILGDKTIKNEEVIFIGNDYNCDVLGPKNIGMRTIWFNQKGEIDQYNISDCIVKTYRELINNFEV